MITDFSSCLDEEVKVLKSRKSRSYFLNNGTLISILENGGYYQFDNTAFFSFSSEVAVHVTIEKKEYFGFISYCSKETVELSIENLKDPLIDSIEVSIASWRLMDSLSKRVKLISENKIIQTLKSEHKNPLPELIEARMGQVDAIEYAKHNPVTLIWGPPGTGKTYTLASIAINAAKEGKRVLIMSQSNISVDGATLAIARQLQSTDLGILKGRVFRYGMSHEPELRSKREFNSHDHVIDIDQNLKESLNQIKEQISHLTPTEKKELKELLSKRQSLLTIVKEKEKKLIDSALIISTTAVKSTIDPIITNALWDLVIFDEVSMAFVPQIFVAASLAKSKLVLLGDFKQLAPIVASNSAELKKDIFQYLNVYDGNKIRKHQWLTILNIQRRMHREIAKYANEKIYEGFIHTDEKTVEIANSICGKGPFSNKPITLVDWSKFKGYCYDNYGSRFNLFSAILSINIAKALYDGGVSNIGIITPYHAQAKLINTILKQLLLKDSKYADFDVFCATVHQFQGFEKDAIIFDTVENYPKKSMGKMFTDEESDSVARLLNVALTRARGKFIIVSNYSYLRENWNDLTKDFWDLIEDAKTENYVFEKNRILDFLVSKNNKVVSVFRDSNQAFSRFAKDINNGTKVIEHWHTYRNHIDEANQSMNKAIGEKFLELINKGVKIKLYTTKNAFSTMDKKIHKTFIETNKSVTDDFLSFDGRKLWFDIPDAKDNFGSLDQIHTPIRIADEEVIQQYYKECEIDKTTAKIQKKVDAKTHDEAMNESGFNSFIAKNYTCPICHGKGKAAISAKSKPYVRCSNCGTTIQSYVENDKLESFIMKKGIKCKSCGNFLKIAKYTGAPYCKWCIGKKINTPSILDIICGGSI